MASIVILTRAKLPGRTGPSSARYEIGRNNALAESLTLRGHEVVMWWDEPLGPCLLETPDLVVIRSGGEINIGRAREFQGQGVPVLNDPEAHWLASDKWATVTSWPKAVWLILEQSSPPGRWRGRSTS